MAQLYPSSPGVSPGGLLHFHVSSQTSQFRIDFYRQGSALVLTGTASYEGGSQASLGTHDADFGWPAFAFSVPQNWRSGVYLALAVEEGGSSDIDDPANRFALSVFVVRSAVPGNTGKILYKLPTFTYVAYNQLADPPGSLYTGTGLKVTMQRPGCGAGADPWDSIYPDVYDGGSPRQTFLHWDQKLIRWLEQEGYALEYCSDLDLHNNPNNLLSHYSLVISGGHDEYWSAEMRNNLEGYIAEGGGVAFLSGNICWWRVHVTDGNTALVCDKSVHKGVPGPYDQWWAGQSQRPENSLTGVSYRNAGGNWAGPRPAATGFTVQYANHWVFENVKRADGSAIADGDVIGAADSLIGYECDGAALAPTPVSGMRVAAGTDGTPSTFAVLGIASVAAFQDAQAQSASMATMGVYRGAGTVFVAATTDWARVLWAGNAQVGQITHNVLNRLIRAPVKIGGLGAPCSDHAAVEGATIHFYADISKLPTNTNLTYVWEATGGHALSNTSPDFELTLPQSTAAITILVTVSGLSGPEGFGHLTFFPMTQKEYQFVQFICNVRAILANLYRFIPPPYEPFTGYQGLSHILSGPLWDNLRGYVGPTPDLASFATLSKQLNRIADMAEELSKKARTSGA